MASEAKENEQIVVKQIKKFDFYNQYIQFLYPTLIVCDAAAADKQQSDVDLLVYNSSTFKQSEIENANDDIIKALAMELRDQGSERFDKMMILIQSKENEQKNIQILCDKMAKNSKSLRTFYILKMDNKLCHEPSMQILSEKWYKDFSANHNKSKCIGYPSIPSLICDGLYLGGLITTTNLFILQSLNISVIINCTKDLKNCFEENGIKYHRIAIDDANNENITKHLKECYKLLKEYVDDKGLNVLVHCQQGKSRSVSMIIYYLMQKNGFGVDEALQHVKQYRYIAAPNEGFMAQLRQIKCN